MTKVISAAIPVVIMMWACTHATADLFGTGANQFEIEFVEVGDPGNDPDMTDHFVFLPEDPEAIFTVPPKPNPAGSVDYIYRIGKFEVSRDMVEKANAEGGLRVTLSSLSFISDAPRPEMPAPGRSSNGTRATSIGSGS